MATCCVLLAAAALATAPADRGAALRIAVDAALGRPGARVEVLGIEGGAPAACAVDRAEAPRPPARSGRAAVRLIGSDAARRPCGAWVWARVRVTAPALVTTRTVATAEPLEGAVALVERELEPGREPLRALPEGARAAQALAAGVALDPSMFRCGPPPGAPVTVALRTDALLVEQAATAVACACGRACALLPSGRRVEGSWHDGRIEVRAP